MSNPLLLDLFCCEGGAGRGYAAAGFDVVGVDLLPKYAKRYPYEFHVYTEWIGGLILSQLTDGIRVA